MMNSFDVANLMIEAAEEGGVCRYLPGGKERLRRICAAADEFMEEREFEKTGYDIAEAEGEVLISFYFYVLEMDDGISSPFFRLLEDASGFEFPETEAGTMSELRIRFPGIVRCAV